MYYNIYPIWLRLSYIHWLLAQESLFHAVPVVNFVLVEECDDDFVDFDDLMLKSKWWEKFSNFYFVRIFSIIFKLSTTIYFINQQTDLCRIDIQTSLFFVPFDYSVDTMWWICLLLCLRCIFIIRNVVYCKKKSILKIEYKKNNSML